MVTIESVPESSGEVHSYLLSRSSLKDYLSFVAEYAADNANDNRRQLMTEWKAAAARMDKLRESEPNRADKQQWSPLPASMRALASKVEADPIFSRAYSDSEYQFGIVDLSNVVVSQRLVCLDHVRRLQTQLCAKPKLDELFRYCLPFDRTPPECKSGRIGDEEFVFHSLSSDLRFQEAVLLRPDQIAGYRPTGPIAGVVALVVGFGSNCLHVLSIDGRLVLNNGHHRACALWQMGLRNVPCVVQPITHPDEIEVHAPRAVRRDPTFYLTDPRPPLLEDYFDPVLSRRLAVALTSKQVRVSYSVEEKDMP
jgi:hypothetical protein